MSLLLEALRQEVDEQKHNFKMEGETVNSGSYLGNSEENKEQVSEYPDYSDYIDYSDTGWSDNWNDGPTHSDSWSDSGWPYKK